MLEALLITSASIKHVGPVPYAGKLHTLAQGFAVTHINKC